MNKADLELCNWSELPYDLLTEIAKRVNKVEDFVVFGAVCKSWSIAGKKKYFKGLWLRQGIPYLLLPVTDDATNDVREFYSLVDGEIVASLSIPKFKKRKCHESLGWLLAAEQDGNMCLLDPFSSVEIQIPHQSTFPGYERHRLDALIFVQKFVLSSRPSKTNDYIVMITCGDLGHLAFWRPGDESWNRIEIRSAVYTDVIYHGGHFYAINYSGHVWEFTLQRDNHPPEGRIVTRLIDDVAKNLHAKNIFNELVQQRNLYLVTTPSQSLLMITRSATWFDEENDRFRYNTRKFQVYEVDMVAGTWTESYNVGSIAIFVGHNATFAIDTSRLFGKIKSNHIYFTDDGWEAYHIHDELGGGKDMGAYSLATGTIEPGEVLLTKIFPSIWVTPCFAL